MRNSRGDRQGPEAQAGGVSPQFVDRGFWNFGMRGLLWESSGVALVARAAGGGSTMIKVAGETGGAGGS